MSRGTGNKPTTLVRFCVLRRDPESHSPQGVFQAVFELRDADRLGRVEEALLEREMSWFRMHLPAPPCLSNVENKRAICWFRPEAREAIRRVRRLVALLESKGAWVDMLTTDDPGSVIYEDRFQVVAKPRRKGRARPPGVS